MRHIRTPVKRSKEFEDTLQKLGGAGVKLFPTLREALTFCAILGYKERRRKPFNSSIGSEDIAGAQYDGNDAVDMMFALALAEAKDSDILRIEREAECVKIYEEYANGGLEMVQSWIDRYADYDVEDAVWKGLQSIKVAPPIDTNASDAIVLPAF